MKRIELGSTLRTCRYIYSRSYRRIYTPSFHLLLILASWTHHAVVKVVPLRTGVIYMRCALMCLVSGTRRNCRTTTNKRASSISGFRLYDVSQGYHRKSAMRCDRVYHSSNLLQRQVLMIPSHAVYLPSSIEHMLPEPVSVSERTFKTPLHCLVHLLSNKKQVLKSVHKRSKEASRKQEV